MKCSWSSTRYFLDAAYKTLIFTLVGFFYFLKPSSFINHRLKVMIITFMVALIVHTVVRKVYVEPLMILHLLDDILEFSVLFPLIVLDLRHIFHITSQSKISINGIAIRLVKLCQLHLPFSKAILG